MKKAIALLLTVVMIFSTSAMVLAYEEGNAIILDGKEIDLDVKPIIMDGRSLVPAKALFENLGFDVIWDADTKTVVGEKEGARIKLAVDSNGDNMYNNIDLSLDVPATVINGRTLVPVKIVTELLGLDIKWDNSTNNVIITTDVGRPEISLEEAYSILVELAKENELEDFTYMPFNSYASSNKEIKEKTYIFGVVMNIDTDDGPEKILYDFNYCVEKSTGDIYIYVPTGEYIYSDKNPSDVEAP